MEFLLTLASLVAYVAGLVTLTKVTPLLPTRAYDDLWFMPIAAGDLAGGILAFGGVWVPLVIFDANIAVRVLAFLLLVGIVFVAMRLALRSFRSRRIIQETYPFSRILAGIYCLALAVAAAFCIVLLFTTPVR